MSDRRSSGLSIGQLITLTFGFLLASVLIFVFGLWVGRDIAEQRLARETHVIRLAVTSPTPLEVPVAPAIAELPAATPTLPAIHMAAAPPAAPKAPARLAPTPTRSPLLALVAPARPTAAVGGGRWTVQANATTDPVQAAVQARELQMKGYDAYTTHGPIGGVTWYRVRVGHFGDKASAKAVEARLRREEGLEAAYVTSH
jgi:cell division protein FtsN